MIRLAFVLALAFALEAGAQTFPVPGPGHAPWVATGGGGGGGNGAGQGANGLEKLADTIAATGATVYCSEPMAGSDSNAPRDWDPSDTQSVSTHECSDIAETDWFSSEQLVTTYDVEPAADGKRALRIDADSKTLFLYAPRANSASRRACVRYYKRVEASYSPASQFNAGCECERNKVSQFAWGNGLSQITENESGSGCKSPPNYGPLVVMNSLGDSKSIAGIRWSECVDGWCRFEHCASGPIRDGGAITVHGRVWSEETGTTASNQEGPWTMTGQSIENTGADLFHGQGTGCQGKAWVKNFMYAEWPVDSGQWIGPACEMEGGC